MAGSLHHLLASDGTFSMSLIENLGDAHEALDECFKIIMDLTGGDRERINSVCRSRGFPSIESDMRPGGPDAID